MGEFTVDVIRVSSDPKHNDGLVNHNAANAAYLEHYLNNHGGLHPHKNGCLMTKHHVKVVAHQQTGQATPGHHHEHHDHFANYLSCSKHPELKPTDPYYSKEYKCWPIKDPDCHSLKLSHEDCSSAKKHTSASQTHVGMGAQRGGPMIVYSFPGKGEGKQWIQHGYHNAKCKDHMKMHEIEKAFGSLALKAWSSNMSAFATTVTPGMLLV